MIIIQKKIFLFSKFFFNKNISFKSLIIELYSYYYILYHSFNRSFIVRLKKFFII